jgi:hypothetical protein
LPGREVDDGKAPVRESEPRLQVQSTGVGTAVEQRSVHALEQGAVDFAPSRAVKYACDAAHDGSPLLE